MASRSVTAVALGQWATNCVVVSDHTSRRAFVVDPGQGGAEYVPKVVGELDVEVEAILLTHGHIDHLWAAPDLATTLDVPVHLHPADRWLWNDPGAGFGLPPDRSAALLEAQFGLTWQPGDGRVQDLAGGDRLQVAGMDVSVSHTPGHTPGSVTFLLDGMAGAEVVVAVGTDQVAPDSVLLSGDLLFAGSIGRTDLAGGDHATMMDSLATHVPTWSDDTLVVAGHGPETTVGRERASNPFVAQALAAASDGDKDMAT